jgi:hypothetical protein
MVLFGGSLVVGRAESVALLGVVVQEVCQDGVSEYRYREYEFLAGIAMLISFGLADEQTNMLGGFVDGEVTD